MDNDIVEIRERLTRIETLLESNIKNLEGNLELRIKKLEDNNTWITRAVIAEVIGIVACFLTKSI